MFFSICFFGIKLVINANVMKCMKDSIPTIGLHCNMAKANTPLSKEILTRDKNKKVLAEVFKD